MKIEREDLALRLTEERVRLGFSLRDFAQKLSISVTGLRYYESGQRGISAEVLSQAAVFGLDVQYVLTGVRSQNRNEVDRAATPTIEINSTGNVIGQAFNSTVTQINTTKHRTVVKAEVKPGDIHIDEQQAARLSAMVKDICELEEKLKKNNPKSYRAVWASLNAHMGVTRYRLIPKEKYEKAEKYLSMWIGRLNSMRTAPVIDGDAWRKRKYAYIKINCKDFEEEVNAYIKKNFNATRIRDLANDELEKTYRYVAAKRQTRRGRV